MNDAQLDSLAQKIRLQLAAECLQDEDPINKCGHAPLQVIEQRPDDVLSLAHEKLHTWKYSEVSICWRRLYEEASLWKVISLISLAATPNPGQGHKRLRNGSPIVNGKAPISKKAHATANTDDWVTKVVFVLDMAIILTGAPRRRDLIHQILNSLKAMLKPQDGLLTSVFPSGPTKCFSEETIARKEKLDFLAFQHYIDTECKPLVMSGVISDWPAIADPKHLWSDPAYLLHCTLGGRRLVPVELGRTYTDEGWSQKIMTFGEYMREHLLQPQQDQVGYLAQHDLFEQIPSLAEDTRIPDYCYTTPPPSDSAYRSTVPVEALDEPLRNAWLGPTGTISTMHTDPYHNILCQVVGYKYVRLYAPSETPNLYPRGIDEAGVNMENTSYVDISLARKLFAAPTTQDNLLHKDVADETLANARIDFESRYPLFKKANYIETILRPGECLYIPVGWWHYVESLSTSFSMSFWWN